MIVIESKRKKSPTLLKEYPNAVFCDVTSMSPFHGLRQLSPYYPWGDIPVSFSPGIKASCVEAVWQGLKVFENADVDTALFSNYTLKGLKRSSRVFGKVLGHRKGVDGDQLLNYYDARKKIYIPTYKWMIEHKAYETINCIRNYCREHPNDTIVLLDYQTNCRIDDLSKPLSHAFLVKAYVEGISPYEDVRIEKKVPNVYFVGRREISSTSIKYSFKELPAIENDNEQLKIEFDE